jgi:hypothetical protein
MNERIKELSKQAEIYALTLVGREDDYVDVFEQKFAELIVKECAKEAAYWWPADYYGAKTVEDRILQHFGVE